MAPVNVILGAVSGAKHAGALAAPAFEDKKGPGMHKIGAGETDLVSEAGPSENSLEA